MTLDFPWGWVTTDFHHFCTGELLLSTGQCSGGGAKPDVSLLLALCCCGTTSSYVGMNTEVWKVEQKLWRVPQAELQLLVKKTLPVADLLHLQMQYRNASAAFSSKNC